MPRGGGRHLSWNDFFGGTIDGMKTDTAPLYQGGGFLPPDRYPRSSGGTTFAGEFAIPAGSSAQVTVLGISGTTYRPLTDVVGNALPVGSQPEIRFQWADPNTGVLSPEFTDEGTKVGVSLNRGALFRYQALWFDNGLTPNSTAAYLDDVTLFYRGDLKFYLLMDEPS